MPENTTKQLLRAALLQFDIRPGEVQHNENTAVRQSSVSMFQVMRLRPVARSWFCCLSFGIWATT